MSYTRIPITTQKASLIFTCQGLLPDNTSYSFYGWLAGHQVLQSRHVCFLKTKGEAFHKLGSLYLLPSLLPSKYSQRLSLHCLSTKCREEERRLYKKNGKRMLLATPRTSKLFCCRRFAKEWKVLIVLQKNTTCTVYPLITHTHTYTHTQVISKQFFNMLSGRA